MFTLDSDLLGLLIALLTFFVPVLTSIMEKRKKKRKEETCVHQRSSEESVQEQDERDFLPDESLHNLRKPAPHLEEDDSHTTAASELEELFNDILGIAHAETKNENPNDIRLNMGTFIFCKDESTATSLKSSS